MGSGVDWQKDVAESGLFAKSGKLDVVCTEGFYRYDNIRITCAKYGVPVYASLTEAIAEIIR